MGNNIVVGGLGRTLVVGGMAGNGLPTGSASLIQNYSFETPGTGPGDASNWTGIYVSSEIEYATFTRPGLNVVADTVPALLPEIGFQIIPQSDGTVVIFQQANEADAAEDFEEGWTNNESFLLALPDDAITFGVFLHIPYESFEAGWNNDVGLLEDFTGLTSVDGHFSLHVDPSTGLNVDYLFESFEGFWPSNAPSTFENAIPNVVFGFCNPTDGTLTPGFNFVQRITDSDINGFAQYADCLQVVITERPLTQFTIGISYFDVNDTLQFTNITILQDTPIGKTIPALNSDPSVIGFRYIDAITPDGTNGYPGIRFEGDPGVLFDQHGIEIDSWVRAEFT